MDTPAMTEMITSISSEASHLRDFLASLDTEAWSRPSAWSATITRAIAGDANPPPGEQMLRPGERGSEVTAQRAIAFRQGMGQAELLQAFTDGYQRLHQVLLTLQPGDWDRPCYHRRGILPVRDYVGLRLQELTIHGWDMRSAFDSAAALSERPLATLVGVAQRWLSNTFRPAL